MKPSSLPFNFRSFLSFAVRAVQLLDVNLLIGSYFYVISLTFLQLFEGLAGSLVPCNIDNLLVLCYLCISADYYLVACSQAVSLPGYFQLSVFLGSRFSYGCFFRLDFEGRGLRSRVVSSACNSYRSFTRFLVISVGNSIVCTALKSRISEFYGYCRSL